MKIKRNLLAALAALALGLVSLGEAAVMACGVAGGIGGEFRAGRAAGQQLRRGQLLQV